MQEGMFLPVLYLCFPISRSWNESERERGGARKGRTIAQRWKIPVDSPWFRNLIVYWWYPFADHGQPRVHTDASYYVTGRVGQDVKMLLTLFARKNGTKRGGFTFYIALLSVRVFSAIRFRGPHWLPVVELILSSYGWGPSVVCDGVLLASLGYLPHSGKTMLFQSYEDSGVSSKEYALV